MAEVAPVDAAGDLPPSEADRRGWLEDAAARLSGGLDLAVGELLQRDGPRLAEDQRWVVVSAYDLSAPCPGRWAHPPGQDDFVDSSANAARRLGRMALRGWSPGRSLTDQVDRVLSDTEDWPTGLRTWFETLDRSGRATVAAAAVAWAAGALGAVGGRDDLTWSRQNEMVSVPDRAVRLSGSWDAIKGRRRAPTAVLVMSNAPPDAERDRLVAGFTALVAGFGPRIVPDRVRLGSASAGTTRPVVVTPELLRAAVDRVVQLVSFRAAPADAPLVPGRWCSHCHLLESCDVGTAHLASPPAPLAP